MSILKVARMGHPVLRAKARPLDPARSSRSRVQKLIDDMIETMQEYHGVGPGRAAGARGRAAVRRRLRADRDRTSDGRRRGRRAACRDGLINPEITVVGNEIVEDWEGCLSIPDIRGRVPRAREIKVRAFDRNGARIEMQRPRASPRASSSTRPITSTACCSSIG